MPVTPLPSAANAYFDDPEPVHTHTLATGHENEVDAGCTTVGGYDIVTYCIECQEVISTSHVEIPATGHTIVSVAEVPATHDASGTAAHYECSVCHKLFTDEQGTIETTLEELATPRNNNVDLSALYSVTGITLLDGDIVTGSLSGSKLIAIDDGATITLKDATIYRPYHA